MISLVAFGCDLWSDTARELLVQRQGLRLSLCIYMQEEEKRYRPGTNKYIAFQVLKAAGPKGLTVPQIMEASKRGGYKEFDETAKRVIQFVRAPHPLSAAFRTWCIAVMLRLIHLTCRFLGMSKWSCAPSERPESTGCCAH